MPRCSPTSATETPRPQWIGSKRSAFRVVTRQPGRDGTVLHAELSVGDAVVMLACADADCTVPPRRPTGRGLDLLVVRLYLLFVIALHGRLVPERPSGTRRRVKVVRTALSSRCTASPISQNIGGHSPTNNARRSALPRSSWSTVLARIHRAMQR
jgi:hypothetical protein